MLVISYYFHNKNNSNQLLKYTEDTTKNDNCVIQILVSLDLKVVRERGIYHTTKSA